MSSYSLYNGEEHHMPYLDSLRHPPQFSIHSGLACEMGDSARWQSTAHSTHFFGFVYTFTWFAYCKCNSLLVNSTCSLRQPGLWDSTSPDHSMDQCQKEQKGLCNWSVSGWSGVCWCLRSCLSLTDFTSSQRVMLNKASIHINNKRQPWHRCRHSQTPVHCKTNCQ